MTVEVVFGDEFFEGEIGQWGEGADLMAIMAVLPLALEVPGRQCYRPHDRFIQYPTRNRGVFLNSLTSLLGSLERVMNFMCPER